ncbi:MAG: hypothetical protein FWD92_02290 [Methanomassiliicoccaceae archaeon]|nr:hypothetical protein [Methanomassiliicoccaceae archaeon]
MSNITVKYGKLFTVIVATILISTTLFFSYDTDDSESKYFLMDDFNDGTWIPISTPEDLSRIGSTGASSGNWPLNGKYYLTDNIFFGPNADLNGGHRLIVTGTLSADGTSMSVTVSNPGGSGSSWRIDTLHVRVEAIHASRSGTSNTSTVSLNLPQSDVNIYTVTVAGFYRAGSTTNLPFAYTFTLDRYQSSFERSFNSNGNMNPLPADFTGILDGNGHIIHGMHIAVYTTSSSSIGLFATTAGSAAQIRNIGITESSVTAATTTRTLNVGGMIGTASAGTQIINSYFDGITAATSTSGALNVGGMIGNAPSGATRVIDSYNTANVSARTNSEAGNAGGIIGVNGGAAQIINTFNMGSVTATTLARAVQSAGGIVGSAAVSTIVTNCYNTGSVFAASTSSNVHAGGITGRNGLISDSGNTGSVTAINTSDSGASNTTFAGGITGLTTRPITNCYNTGDVTSVSRLPYAGGIVGSSSSSSNVTLSFNTGEVLAGGLSSNPARAGGIAGQAAGQITDCYNTGDITGENMTSGTSSSRTARAGGIAGETSNVIRNCYSVGTVTAQTANNNVPLAGGIAGSVSASAARIANSYYLQDSVMVNGTVLSQLIGGGNSTAINNIDGGTLAHNPPRAQNQMSSAAKTADQMRPSIETAANNGSIYYTGTVGTGSSAIPGWNFNRTWTIDPSKNNGFPILQSRAATLTIDKHPYDEYLNPGDTAVFRVSASTAPPNDHILHQWQVSADNGETWSDIPGAVSDTYKIYRVTYDLDDNLYRCVVSTVFGLKVSHHAVLHVSGAKKTISGTVLHDDGIEEHPLPGVVISLTVNDTQQQVTTDGEGSYEIVVPIYSKIVINSLDKAGYVISAGHPMNFVFQQIQTDHENNFFMIPDGSRTMLHGTVTHNEHPLGDVRIDYVIHMGGVLVEEHHILSSPVSGEYSIPAPYGSVVTITSVSLENYTHEGQLPSVYIHEATEQDIVMIVDPNLSITIDINGIVLEYLNQTALEGVTIGYIISDPNDPLSFDYHFTVSDGNGHFTLENIPFGSNVIISEAAFDGYIRVGILPLIYVDDSTELLTVHMSSRENVLFVSGEIISESSEGPVFLSGVLISYRIDNEEGFVLTDDHGHYVIGVFSGQHVEIISVTKEGFKTDETTEIPTLIVAENINKERNFIMLPVSTIDFTVTGSVSHDGIGLPNITIFYTIDDSPKIFSVKTDANGNYVITAAAGQTIKITDAERDGYVLTPADQVPAVIFIQSDTTNDLYMEPDETTEFKLSGIVVDGSKPVAGIKIEYRIDDGEIKNIITDRNGKYEIKAASGSFLMIISLNYSVQEEMPMLFYIHTDKTQNFVMQTYGAGSVTVTLTPGNFDNGIIYWSVTGGDDPDDYSQFKGEITFMIGAEIHILAVPDQDHEFLRWTGISAGLPAQTQIHPTADTSIGAVFWKDKYTLTPVIDVLYTLYITIGDESESEFTESLRLPEGTQITVRAEFNAAGYSFSYWTGIGGIGNPYVFDLDSDHTIGVAFYKDTDSVHTLTPGSHDNGKILITLDGIEREFDRPVTLLADTVVPITATGNSGFGFSYWTGYLKGTIVRTSVVMNADKTVGAVFYDHNEYFELIRDDTYGTAEAVIRWSADGVNFADLTGVIKFPAGTALVITADDDLSYWTGDIGGNENPKKLVMDSDYKIGAVLYRVSGYTITITQHNHGGIYWNVFMISDDEQIPLNTPSLLTQNTITVPVNTRISFEAVGIGSWEFENWFGGFVNITDETAENYYLNSVINIHASAAVSISNRTLGAAFHTSAEHTLTPGTASGGKITIQIPEMGINEEFTRPIVVKEGYTVTIIAAGNTFSHWTGIGALENPHTFPVTGNITIGAVFYGSSDEVFTLTPGTAEKGSVFISIEGNEEVRFTAPVTLKVGTEVTLSAEGGNGYDFLHWTGLAALCERHTFRISENLKVGAVFCGVDCSVMILTPYDGNEGGETYFAYGETGQWILFDRPVAVIDGTEVSFKAVATDGNVFSHWIGTITLDGVFTFRAHDDKAIGAVFYDPNDPDTYFTITGKVTGGGEIWWAVADVHELYEPLSEPITFAKGITIYLKAHADEGWTLIEWPAGNGVYAHSGSSDLIIGAEFKILIDIDGIEIIVTESHVYTGKDIKPEITVILVSTGQPLVQGKDHIAEYENNKNAGTAKVTITFIGDYHGTAAVTFEITKAVLTVTVDKDQNKIYGTADPVFTYTVTGWKGQDEENAPSTLTVVLIRENGEDAGVYSISYELLFESGGNYTIRFVESVFTITPAMLTVTADPGHKTYGDADPALTYTVTGWQFADEANKDVILSGSLTRENGENADSYSINQGTLIDTSGNYTIQFLGSAFTITPAVLTITADDLANVYGATDPVFTYTVTGWQFADEANKDAILTGSLERDAGISVGSYTIHQGTLVDTSGNYTIEFIEAVLTITPATLTVTADDLTEIYGTNDPVFTYTVMGWEHGDDNSLLSGSLARDTGINVGSYTIHQGTLTDTSGNYTIRFVESVFTITHAVLTITADDITKVYGTNDPVFTYKVTGWEHGDNNSLLSGSLARDTGINVGSYTIHQGTLTDTSGNYTIRFVESVFTITHAVLTVTADDITKVYGTNDPVFTYKVTGWEHGDNNSLLSGSLAREQGENAGSYSINQGTLIETSGNYTIEFIEAVFTITPAVLTVTADDITKTYGAADPVFTYTVMGWQFADEANKDNIITGAPAREQGENVGSYNINQGTLADISGNYVLYFIPAGLNITALVVDAASIDVTVETNHEYTGNPIEPVPVVMLGNMILTEGIDYTVSYTDNISAGTSAVMTITFKGNYSGCVEIKFGIHSEMFFITGTVFDNKHGTELAAEIKYEINGVVQPVIVTGPSGSYMISGIPWGAEVSMINVHVHGYLHLSSLPSFGVTASVHDADISMEYDGISTFAITVKADEGTIFEFTLDNWKTAGSFVIGPSGEYTMDGVPYETIIEKRVSGNFTVKWENDQGDVTEGDFILLAIQNSGVSVTLFPAKQNNEGGLSCLLVILLLALLFKAVWLKRRGKHNLKLYGHRRRAEEDEHEK